MPTAYHSSELKRATAEIPVAGRHNFYTGVRQVSIKVSGSGSAAAPR